MADKPANFLEEWIGTGMRPTSVAKGYDKKKRTTSEAAPAPSPSPDPDHLRNGYVRTDIKKVQDQ